MQIKKYLLLSLEDRQSHVDLSTSCIERGGTSSSHKGVLAQFLNTNIYTKPLDLCHACHNAKCSNPKHLYWGTRRENVQDSIDNGTHITPWVRLKESIGEDAARELFRTKSNEFYKKQQQQGIDHPLKNTMYINNGKVSKRIDKSQDVPHGWTKGRLKFK